jgi:3-phenylpropionate/trans-cinnamate dioxygenase ferredoxin reductase subunit
MSPQAEPFVIVGAGLAGAKAAEALREEGYDGRLVLIGDEPERPYERPPLSKEFLRGESDGEPYVHDEGFYEENDIELWTSSRVESLVPDAAEVALEGGRRQGYERLLLATGSEPRRLEVPGADLEGIHDLRTLADSRRIAERFEPGKRLVVVGSGWIGAEIAASARQKGCEVTMLEMASLPLERVLGPELGRIYLQLHRDNGVEFIPETTVKRFEGEGSVERVETADGALLDADFVVVGIGIVPMVRPFKGSGLRIDDGIPVDAGLESSVPGIFAAGDVANAFHPFYDRRLRVEHWANALKQGPVAARAMLGKEASYEEIPYFFSDQYDSGMEYSGYATEWDEIVFRGDVEQREFVAFWLKDERVIAGMNMNVWDVHDSIRELIRSRAAVEPERLRDPDVAFGDLVAQGQRT